MPIDMSHGSEISITGNLAKSNYPIEAKKSTGNFESWSFPVTIDTGSDRLRVTVESKFEPKVLLDILKNATAVSLKAYFAGSKSNKDGSIFQKITAKTDSIVPLAASRDFSVSAIVEGQIKDVTILEEGSVVSVVFRRKNYKDGTVSWKYGTVVINNEILGNQKLETGKFIRVTGDSVLASMEDNGPIPKYTPYVTATTAVVGSSETTLCD